MKKVITHNGKTFSLKLKLNASIERRPGGKIEHLLSSMGIEPDNNWNKSWMIDNSKMKEEIENAEQEIRDYADGKKLSQEEEIAQGLGFTTE